MLHLDPALSTARACAPSNPACTHCSPLWSAVQAQALGPLGPCCQGPKLAEEKALRCHTGQLAGLPSRDKVDLANLKRLAGEALNFLNNHRTNRERGQEHIREKNAIHPRCLCLQIYQVICVNLYSFLYAVQTSIMLFKLEKNR